MAGSMTKVPSPFLGDLCLCVYKYVADALTNTTQIRVLAQICVHTEIMHNVVCHHLWRYPLLTTVIRVADTVRAEGPGLVDIWPIISPTRASVSSSPTQSPRFWLPAARKASGSTGHLAAALIEIRPKT
jgi:hypothetical protein